MKTAISPVDACDVNNPNEAGILWSNTEIIEVGSFIYSLPNGTSIILAGFYAFETADNIKSYCVVDDNSQVTEVNTCLT
jgi:hypothetical protein